MPIVTNTPYKFPTQFIPYSYFDTFDVSHSGYADPKYWGGPFPARVEGSPVNYAELTGTPDPSGASQLRHLYKLSGDFDIVVNYEIVSGWSAPAVEDQLSLRITDADTQTENRIIYRESNNNRVTATDGVSYLYNTVSIVVGGLRILRSGSNIILYYRDGHSGGWTQRGLFSDLTGNADALCWVYVNNTDNVIYIHDVTITADAGYKI